MPVVLFDLPAKEGPKSGIALRAIENLKKLSPAPLGIKDESGLIQAANYEDDIALLKECDVVIEAIAERMDWKHDLYKKVAPHLGANTIFATNTSGLSITGLSDGFDAELKARFCGVHFFNPPRYMHLVELIPTATTQPEILDKLEAFLTTTLGKGVVRAKDTPNFIANRVGIFSILAVFAEAEKFGIPFDVVDDLTGSKLGRAKSATFRTADVVGLDTMAHVIKTMQDNLHEDPFAPVYKTPAVLKGLVDAGALGQKTAPASTRRKARPSRCSTPRPASMSSRARRPTRSSRACSRRRRRNASSCCANRRIRRRSSCGPSSAMCFTTSPCTSSRSPIRRPMSTSRSAGASAGTRARSRTGRPLAGSRWPNG